MVPMRRRVGYVHYTEGIIMAGVEQFPVGNNPLPLRVRWVVIYATAA